MKSIDAIDDVINSWFSDTPQTSHDDAIVLAAEKPQKETETETEEDKRMSRLIRNRMSAKASRARVKQRIERCSFYELRCRHLEQEIAKLNYYIYVLQQDNLRLKNNKK